MSTSSKQLLTSDDNKEAQTLLDRSTNSAPNLASFPIATLSAVDSADLSNPDRPKSASQGIRASATETALHKLSTVVSGRTASLCKSTRMPQDASSIPTVSLAESDFAAPLNHDLSKQPAANIEDIEKRLSLDNPAKTLSEVSSTEAASPGESGLEAIFNSSLPLTGLPADHTYGLLKPLDEPALRSSSPKFKVQDLSIPSPQDVRSGCEEGPIGLRQRRSGTHHSAQTPMTTHGKPATHTLPHSPQRDRSLKRRKTQHLSSVSSEPVAVPYLRDKTSPLRCVRNDMEVTSQECNLVKKPPVKAEEDSEGLLKSKGEASSTYVHRAEATTEHDTASGRPETTTEALPGSAGSLPKPETSPWCRAEPDLAGPSSREIPLDGSANISPGQRTLSLNTELNRGHNIARPRHPPPRSSVTSSPVGFSVFSGSSLNSFMSLRARHLAEISQPDKEARSSAAVASSVPAELKVQESRSPSQLSRKPVPKFKAELSNDPIQNTQSSAPCAIQVPATPILANDSFSPTFKPITSSRVFIADESLLRNRPLGKLFEQHSDHLRVVYRQLENGVSAILSPTTCLLLTNVQELAQRSLPGQKATRCTGTVEDRIVVLAALFETVIVCVSLPSCLSQTHLSLLGDFTAFCASFRCQAKPGSGIVRPYFVRSEAAAQTRPKMLDIQTAWLWHFIESHALHPPEGSSFIDDTTLWEVFLGRMGVNPLAGQLMLGMLKRETAADGGAWGLKRLVCMSATERDEKFGKIVGRRCIDRMAEAFDGAL
jgi:hypothetical protein